MMFGMIWTPSSEGGAAVERTGLALRPSHKRAETDLTMMYFGQSFLFLIHPMRGRESCQGRGTAIHHSLLRPACDDPLKRFQRDLLLRTRGRRHRTKEEACRDE